MVERGVICSIAGFCNEIAPRLIKDGCIISLSAETTLPYPPSSTTDPCPMFGCVGMNMYHALEEASGSGMTPGQSIVAATKHGAMACGALKDYGTLEVGKYADLLILEANPLENIRNFRLLSLVMKEGKRHV